MGMRYILCLVVAVTILMETNCQSKLASLLSPSSSGQDSQPVFQVLPPQLLNERSFQSSPQLDLMPFMRSLPSSMRNLQFDASQGPELMQAQAQPRQVQARLLPNYLGELGLSGAEQYSPLQMESNSGAGRYSN